MYTTFTLLARFTFLHFLKIVFDAHDISHKSSQLIIFRETAKLLQKDLYIMLII